MRQLFDRCATGEGQAWRDLHRTYYPTACRFLAHMGVAGDDSRFPHALCLEALGRTDEARLAYRDYLVQPGTAHAREAKRRMERLVR